MTKFDVLDPLYDVDYWTRKFEEQVKITEPLRRKVMDNCRDFSVLTTEEQYRLTEALMQYNVFTTLLRQDLEEEVERREAKQNRPFWQKILRK